jgi:hypothetical protein
MPNSKVTAFSNSRTQKLYIDEQAKAKGLSNLTVITGDVVDYEFEKEAFNRVVSIEVRVTRWPRPSSLIYILAIRTYEKLRIAHGKS